jgi:hypothetical protein
MHYKNEKGNSRASVTATPGGEEPYSRPLQNEVNFKGTMYSRYR